jgi:hypothetical protein
MEYLIYNTTKNQVADTREHLDNAVVVLEDLQREFPDQDFKIYIALD